MIHIGVIWGGRWGQMPLQNFLYLRIVLLPSWRGQIKKIGVRVRKRCVCVCVYVCVCVRVCVRVYIYIYIKDWFKPFFPLLNWLLLKLKSLIHKAISPPSSPPQPSVSLASLFLWCSLHERFILSVYRTSSPVIVRYVIHSSLAFLKDCV